MILIDLIKKINEIESGYEVSCLKYNDFNPWPYIRIKLIHKINSKQNASTSNKAQVVRKNSTRSKIMDIGYAFLRYMRNPIKKEKIDILYFTRHSELQNVVDNKLFNRYSDSLIHFVGNEYKVKVLETKDTKIKENTNYTNTDIVYIDFITKLASIKARVKMMFSINNELTNINILKEELEIEVLQQELATLNELAKSYEKVLKKLEPKVVFLVCFYRPDAMAMSLACHRLDIKVVEYQHGAQNDNHSMYTNWHSIPKQGYELIPDTFWMWGDVNKQRIDKWACNTTRHKAIVGGNMWLSYNKQAKNKTVSADINAKLTILVSLQGDKFIPEFFITFLEKFGDMFHWYFRDHPRIPISKKYKHIFEKYPVENIESTSKRELYPLLQTIDVNITGFSTVAFEAQSFGVPTIFIHENAKDGFENLLGKDGLYYADNDLELNYYINNIKNISLINDFYIVSDENRIKEEIRNLLK